MDLSAVANLRRVALPEPMGWDIGTVRRALSDNWLMLHGSAFRRWLVPADTPLKGLVSALLASALILVLAILVARPIAWLGDDETVGWVQAVGAILAIVSGFAIALYQRGEERRDALSDANATAQAAHMLAYHALETVSERLDSILNPSDTVTLSLRGSRTAEMVAAMREFDTARFPPALLSDFIQLRSHVHAVNERVSEVYALPREVTSGGATRHASLVSTVRAHAGAVEIYRSLDRIAVERFGAAPLPLALHSRIEEYRPDAPRLL